LSTRSDEAAQAAIGAAARELRLPTIRAEANRLAEIAIRERQSYLVFLAELLAAEVDDCAERRRARRITEAKFPRMKRLSEFNVDTVPTIQAAHLATLASGAYLNAGEPVVLLGDSGTGKTHLLIGLGLAACEQGRKVRYVTTAQLVNELVEAADERVLSRVVARYGRLDLLLLDELGYVQIDPRGAELLFQIITEREERASIALASNLPFSEWGSVFPDPRLVAAIVDRITFNAHPRNRHRLLPAPNLQDLLTTETDGLTNTCCAAILSVGSTFVAEPIGPFLGLDASQAVELGELLASLSDWLASDPSRLDASLHDFIGVPDYLGSVYRIDELRSDMEHFARMLLGYDTVQ
jgi:DNA replication protein DnaC